MVATMPKEWKAAERLAQPKISSQVQNEPPEDLESTSNLHRDPGARENPRPRTGDISRTLGVTWGSRPINSLDIREVWYW